MKSSSNLEGALTRLSEYTHNLPSVNGFAEQANVELKPDMSNDDKKKVLEVIKEKDEEATTLKEQVVNMANSELSAPNITPDQVENINMIKQDAEMIAEQANDAIVSSIQAVLNLF
jgi:predicted neuraminidase